MAAHDSLRHEGSRARQFLWDRPEPTRPFLILRKRRRGYLPERTPALKGQVYVASCDGLESGVFKIGKSTDHFSKRSQALSQPTGVPGFYFPVYRLETDGFDELEKKALHHLRAFRLHRRKEFLACPLEDIVEKLQSLQRDIAPLQPFSEHFYFAIEDFEEELLRLYESLLLRPGPESWPKICIFLSLTSGLSPREVLVSLQFHSSGLPSAFSGLRPDFHTAWLAEYLRGLMSFEKLPFGRELASLQLCSSYQTEELGEECERWDWFFRQWEDCLWEGIESLSLLRRIQSCLMLDSPSLLCALVYRRAREYVLGSSARREDVPCGSLFKRAFHFI